MTKFVIRKDPPPKSEPETKFWLKPDEPSGRPILMATDSNNQDWQIAVITSDGELQLASSVGGATGLSLDLSRRINIVRHP